MDKNIKIDRKKLSLRKKLIGDIHNSQQDKSCNALQRTPLQDLSVNDNVRKLLNRDITFTNIPKHLNNYNKTLLESVGKWNRGQPQDMASRKRLKKSDNTQTSILSYFGSQKSINNSQFNSTLNNKIITSNIGENKTENTVVIDLCDSLSSSNEDTNRTETDFSSSNVTLPVPFQSCSVVGSSQDLPISVPPVISNKDVSQCSSSLTPSRITPRFGRRRGVSKPCPAHKIVKGTPFAVDAFNYGQIPNVSAYFLTHFHSDHYVGLNKAFDQPLYCSKITGELCMKILGVKQKCVHILEMDCSVDVMGICVTPVEANHCPGAIMLVFSLPSGKNILHTGDFRASSLMESYPVLWNKQIHTVYLDTTYCDPRYRFPSQEESVEEAVSVILEKRRAMEAEGRPFHKLLIVCGTYKLGKEKFFLGIAERLGLDIWTSPEKRSILDIALDKRLHYKSPKQCQLHVMPMMKLQYNYLSEYLKGVSDRFDELLALRPSGWEVARSGVIQRGNITIQGIPYSEHSSFLELQRFICYLMPENIVPTVPTNKDLQTYFPCHLGDSPRGQKKLTQYFPAR